MTGRSGQPPTRVVVEADGGSRGNPGPAGYGALVLDPVSGAVLAERAEALGIATNNVAEYSGLIAGLRAAKELGASEVDVRMDSKLVVEQMSGRWQVKNEGLRPLAGEAAALARDFARVSYQWIPRARNSRADALANQAMDGTPVSSTALAVATHGQTTEPKPPVTGWAPRVDPPTRLILVRHGETPLTVGRKYSGRGDVPLTPKGEAQAKAAAGRVGALADDVAAIVASPLMRTRQTAAAIADRYRRQVAIDSDFIECDFGSWEGRSFAEVSENWPVELTAWLGSTAVAPPEGESFDQVAERVRSAIERLRSRYPGKTVVVVSHVSPIKVALRDALEGGPSFLHRLHLDPAGVSLLDSWPDGGVSVKLINDTAHLG